MYLYSTGLANYTILRRVMYTKQICVELRVTARTAAPAIKQTVCAGTESILWESVGDRCTQGKKPVYWEKGSRV